MSVLESMTDAEKAKYRQLKRTEMLNHNRDFIKDIKIEDGDFNMKYPFTKNGQIVVSCFVNEFLKPKGYYFELIDNNLNPSDPERTIYRLPHTVDFKNKYEYDTGSKDYNPKYLVPLSQLPKVNRQSATILKENYIKQFDHMDESILDSFIAFEDEINQAKSIFDDVDAPCSDMTIRDYIAIHTGKPVSKKEWINDLVKN
jgi:hypothetical protein